MSEPTATQHTVKVYRPNTAASASTTPSLRELPDSYFQPTVHELSVAYGSAGKQRERLVEAPLLTKRLRDEKAANVLASKRAKYPNTRIRVKFADQTQIETSFASGVTIDAIYSFVVCSLREDVKETPFVLYQTPPRKEYARSDAKVKGVSLLDLDFAPSTMLYIKFDVDTLNDRHSRPPLLPELLEAAEDLPPPKDFDAQPPVPTDAALPADSKASGSDGGKKLPKWLNKAVGKSALFPGFLGRSADDVAE